MHITPIKITKEANGDESLGQHHIEENLENPIPFDVDTPVALITMRQFMIFLLLDQKKVMRRTVFVTLSILMAIIQILSFKTLIEQYTESESQEEQLITSTSAYLASFSLSSMINYYFLLEVFSFFNQKHAELELTKEKGSLIKKGLLLTTTLLLGELAAFPYYGITPSIKFLAAGLIFAFGTSPLRAPENMLSLMKPLRRVTQRIDESARTQLENGYANFNKKILYQIQDALKNAKTNLFQEKNDGIIDEESLYLCFQQLRTTNETGELISHSDAAKLKIPFLLWLTILKNSKNKAPYPESTLFNIFTQFLKQGVAGIGLGVLGTFGYITETYHASMITFSSTLLKWKLSKEALPIIIGIFSTLSVAPFLGLIFVLASQYVAEEFIEFMYRAIFLKKPDLPLAFKLPFSPRNFGFMTLQAIAFGLTGFFTYGAEIPSTQLDEDTLFSVIRLIAVYSSNIGTRFLYPWVGITLSVSSINCLIRFWGDKQSATKASLKTWLEDLYLFFYRNQSSFPMFNQFMHDIFSVINQEAQEQKENLHILIEKDLDTREIYSEPQLGYRLNKTDSSITLSFLDNKREKVVDLDNIPGLKAELQSCQDDKAFIECLRNNHSLIQQCEALPILTGSLNSKQPMTCKELKMELLNAVANAGLIDEDQPEISFMEFYYRKLGISLIPDREQLKKDFNNYSPLDFYNILIKLEKQENKIKHADSLLGLSRSKCAFLNCGTSDNRKKYKDEELGLISPH